ncbi:MAG: hypothetical protein E6J91_29715 [Deltaproteobacteria bacterium]|nr:MAG: hypothetical protein E6J91_29715 [Deltaproteobacteria bacterium]
MTCAMPVSAAPASSPATLADKYKLTDPDAVTHFLAGNTAYKAGADKRRPRADRERDLARAIAEYTAGQAKQDRPVFDFNLALTYKALGRTDEAIEHLQRFLDLADDTITAEARADAETKLAALDRTGKRRAELAEKRPAARRPGPPPAPMPNPTAPPVATEPAPRSSSSSAAMQSPHAPPELATIDTTTTHSSVRWTRIGGSGLAGAGLVGAGVTGWLVIDAQRLDNQAADAQAHPMGSERQQLIDRASARRRSAVLVGIGSGVLLASGAAILLLWSGDEPAPARVGWNLGITGNGLAVSGQF